MKYLNILFFVLLTSNTYSQSYEYIKRLDTIYISFKPSVYNIKIEYPEEKKGFKNKGYLFNYKKENRRTFRFELDKNNRSENTKINKSFLRKNKKKQ